MENERVFDLIKQVKVGYENVFMLHHNIVSTNYFVDHDKMKDYYEMLIDMADEIIEVSYTADLYEPTIAESVEDYEVLKVKEYSANECYKYVYDLFNDLITSIDYCKKDCSENIIGKLDEWKDRLMLDANFKIAHLLGEQSIWKRT